MAGSKTTLWKSQGEKAWLLDHSNRRQTLSRYSKVPWDERRGDRNPEQGPPAARGSCTYLVLLILARVRETRDHSGHPGGRRDLAGVDHDQQLHQVVVDLAAAALDDVDVFPSNALTNLHAWRRKMAAMNPKAYFYRVGSPRPPRFDAWPGLSRQLYSRVWCITERGHRAQWAEGKGAQGESRCKLLRVVPSGVTQVELKSPSNELWQCMWSACCVPRMLIKRLGVWLGGWSCRHHLPGTYQNPRFPGILH